MHISFIDMYIALVTMVVSCAIVRTGAAEANFNWQCYFRGKCKRFSFGRGAHVSGYTTAHNFSAVYRIKLVSGFVNWQTCRHSISSLTDWFNWPNGGGGVCWSGGVLKIFRAHASNTISTNDKMNNQWSQQLKRREWEIEERRKKRRRRRYMWLTKTKSSKWSGDIFDAICHSFCVCVFNNMIVEFVITSENS